jgi:hypothetical protein
LYLLLRPSLVMKGASTARAEMSRAKSGLYARHPTRIREREWKIPNTFRSHNTTPITTTPLSMDLMLPAIGMKRFTSHRRNPTMIRANKM